MGKFIEKEGAKNSQHFAILSSYYQLRKHMTCEQTNSFFIRKSRRIENVIKKNKRCMQTIGKDYSIEGHRDANKMCVMKIFCGCVYNLRKALENGGYIGNFWRKRPKMSILTWEYGWKFVDFSQKMDGNRGLARKRIKTSILSRK